MQGNNIILSVKFCRYSLLSGTIIPTALEGVDASNWLLCSDSSTAVKISFYQTLWKRQLTFMITVSPASSCSVCFSLVHVTYVLLVEGHTIRLYFMRSQLTGCSRLLAQWRCSVIIITWSDHGFLSNEDSYNKLQWATNEQAWEVVVCSTIGYQQHQQLSLSLHCLIFSHWYLLCRNPC